MNLNLNFMNLFDMEKNLSWLGQLCLLFIMTWIFIIIKSKIFRKDSCGALHLVNDFN